MKNVLMILMLIIAVGLVGCPHNRGHDSDRNRDQEHHDRDNRDHDQDQQHHQ